MDCWWASIRMVSAFYQQERSRPEHWNPRFATPSPPVPSRHHVVCGSNDPVEVPQRRRYPLESHYAVTWAHTPPHLWERQGMPARRVSMEVLCDLMRGRLGFLSGAFSSPDDWNQAHLETVLAAHGPLLATAHRRNHFGQSIYHMVVATGVSEGHVLFLDPAIPPTHAGEARTTQIDQFRSDHSRLPLLIWTCRTNPLGTERRSEREPDQRPEGSR